MAQQAEIIEADFFQYYHIDLYDESIANNRLRGLIIKLPPESRFIRKNAPQANWDIRDETISRLLLNLEAFIEIYSSHHSKTKCTPKRPEQFQPEYIKKAKNDAIKQLRKDKSDKKNMKEIANFWESRNQKSDSM